jgi:hypothetical protein
MGLIASGIAQDLKDQLLFHEGKHLIVQVRGTVVEAVLDESGQGGLKVGRPDRQGRSGFRCLAPECGR